VQAATNITFSSFIAHWSSVAGATGYQLDVSTSNTFATYVPGYQNLDVGNATSYPVMGLSSNTTFYYRVRAYNACGTSSNSSTKNAKTLPCVPSAPSLGSATNIAWNSFTAHWRSLTGVIDYRIDVATDSSFTNYVYQDVSVGNVTSFAVTGLTPNTTYYYRVRAFNGCATSSNSSVKTVLTKPCTPGAPSAQTAANVTSSSFSARWSSVTGAIDYRLDVATDSSFSNYVPGYQNLSVGNVTSFAVTGLSPNTIYYYRVRAFNGCAPSANSSVKSVQTRP
jgi:phosphodiesterase/alkaline phosphatase D-like protein